MKIELVFLEKGLATTLTKESFDFGVSSSDVPIQVTLFIKLHVTN